MKTTPTAEQTELLPPTARDPWKAPVAVSIRTATTDDAPAVQALISHRGADARLLPRHESEIAAHADRFVVAVRGATIVACADLVPLGSRTAEVRSLVVDPEARTFGVGDRLLAKVAARARALGFETLCAFTHTPAWFIHRGFAIVPHTWVPEKLAADCRNCHQFRQCDQIAVTRALADGRGLPAEGRQ